MHRRNVLKGALAVFGASAAGASLLSTSAEAAALDLLKPEASSADPADAHLSAEPAGLEEPDAEGQYYYYRRPRRRRVYYYRPRRRIVYYRRPRRVYYYRPRRRFYRRRVYW